jgi:glyoxalase family protein
MKLEGIHHITCITADAQRNVDFYARLLGLRMVKKTVNQDSPDVYHLFYADEQGSPGADLTFFEFPQAARGRAGDGMVHRIVWRVGSTDCLDFWAERLGGEGHASERHGDRLRFRDPEGLELELAVVETPDPPLVAEHPEIPAELALQGFVHHVAWASQDEDHEAWRERAIAAGAHPTPVIDRFWFRSIYFREPSGVLFELATFSPGFAADEDPEHLGETLVLPPWLESRRSEIEAILTPIKNPRQVTA